MKRSWRKLIIAFGLLLYVLLVALSVVHYRFPYRQAAGVLVQDLEASSPIRLSFRGPKAGLPFSYEVKNISLDLERGQQTHVLAFFEKLAVRLQPSRFISKRIGAGLVVTAMGGSIEGQVDYLLTGSRDINLNLDKIDLKDFVFTDPGGRGRLVGHLTGQILLQGQNGLFPTGGQGVFNLTEGHLSELKIPDLPLTELDIETMVLKFKLEKSQLIIQEFDVSGSQAAAALSGRLINLNRPLCQFNGTARMGPEDKPLMKVKFRVTGPLSHPRLKVTSSEGLLPLDAGGGG